MVGADAQRALSSGAFALAFAPDGRTVVYSPGRVLFGWDPARARESHRLELAEHVLDAAFTPGAPGGQISPVLRPFGLRHYPWGNI